MSIASSIASACAAPIVVSAFPDDATLLNETLRPKGVLASLRDEAIHVAIGLHGCAAVDRVSREHERRGRHFIAAPLLLAPAAEAHAATVLGGAPQALDRVGSVFDAMKVSIVARCDRPVDAALLASAHSAMVGCAVEAIAEAFALVRQFGVDPTVMRDVISDALFAGTAYTPIADAMLTGGDDDAPSVARGVQILDLALSAAQRVHVPLPSVDACRDRLLAAIAAGDDARPWTVLSTGPRV